MAPGVGALRPRRFGAFGRLAALRPASEPALLRAVPWRTRGSPTTVSAASQGGERGDLGPGGRRRPRPQPRGGRPREAERPRGATAARAGVEAPRGPGRPRGWEPDVLTRESWRCEELRLGEGGLAVAWRDSFELCGWLMPVSSVWRPDSCFNVSQCPAHRLPVSYFPPRPVSCPASPAAFSLALNFKPPHQLAVLVRTLRRF